MNIQAHTANGPFRITERCGLEVAVTADAPLNAGDTIRFQFPNTWSLINGPSFTRDFQTDDPEGEHHVSVSTGKGDSGFPLAITKSHLNFREGAARHGRLFTAEVPENIPAGETVFIRYRNTYAPYVSEEETLWMEVNGKQPDELPRLITLPGEHERFRVISPSAAAPGKTFQVLVVSLDQYDNSKSRSTPFVIKKRP
ncbi:MAG: hypothetical protein ACLFSE_07155 [Spirochaetia bacterium]